MKIIEHPKVKCFPKNISVKKKIEILLASELKVARFSTYNEETKKFEDYYLPYFGGYIIGNANLKNGFSTPKEAFDYGIKLKKKWEN